MARDLPLSLPQLGVEAMRHAAMRTLASLEMSTGWKKLFLAEGELHLGDDPIQADEDAHREFSRALMSHPAADHLRIQDVVGEERLGPIPPLASGQRLVVVDPLDGSSQWAMVRAGYCVASLMLVADSAGRLRFESAIVSNPTHTFTLIAGEPLTFGPTYGRSSEDIVVLSCLPENEVVPPSIAFTGYKPKDRGSMLALVGHLPRWSFLTIGGNPVTPYVVAGGLTAAVTIRSQATWDAIGILMCAQTDAVVGDLDGSIRSGNDVLAKFNHVTLTSNTRPIQPMVVAKDEKHFTELVEAIGKARNDFGDQFGAGMDGWGLAADGG